MTNETNNNTTVLLTNCNQTTLQMNEKLTCNVFGGYARFKQKRFDSLLGMGFGHNVAGGALRTHSQLLNIKVMIVNSKDR